MGALLKEFLYPSYIAIVIGQSVVISAQSRMQLVVFLSMTCLVAPLHSLVDGFKMKTRYHLEVGVTFMHSYHHFNAIDEDINILKFMHEFRTIPTTNMMYTKSQNYTNVVVSKHES